MNSIKHLCAFITIIMLLSGCDEKNPTQQTPQLIFTDIAQKVGLTVKHENGMNGQLYFIEMMGPAAAFLDYDNDGDLDVYIGQGGILGNDTENSPAIHGTLYRNELNNGELHFVDVTKESGLISFEYSMGIATGDINNDGFVDVYLTNYGNNRLFINNTDGTFTDITESSQTNDPRWSTSAAFFDANGDNWLDLYISNYVDYEISRNKTCTAQTGKPDYCGPNAYANVNDKLLINQGNNTFTDESLAHGIALKGAGLGVVTADFNQDQQTDIYVTNDMGHNFLWLKDDNGFKNQALMRGSAVNKHGKPEASMGVDAGDFDNDGDFDLFMTHLLNETNTIYKNDGQGYFTDATSITGLGEPSKGYTGFGTAFLDFDNDGWLDILAINGAVRLIQEQIDDGVILALQQSNQLFHNQSGSFIEITADVPVLSIKNVSRGTAIGDIDNDGDTDVLVTNNHSKAQLLINHVGHKKQWIGLQLQNKNGKYMLGSVATITLENGQKITRRSRTDASYISANDPRIIIGLDDHQKDIDVSVLWSDGQTSEYKNLSLLRYHQLIHPAP